MGQDTSNFKKKKKQLLLWVEYSTHTPFPATLTGLQNPRKRERSAITYLLDIRRMQGPTSYNRKITIAKMVQKMMGF